MSSKDKKQTNPVQSPIDDFLVLICEKCGKKLSKDPKESKSFNLFKELKININESGKKQKIRPLLTSCMSLCPKDKITTAIVSIKGKHPTRFFTTSEKGAKQILEILNKK